MSGDFAHAMVYLRIAGKLGAICVLAKPFSPETLIAAMNDALGRRV
jgi:hypothetical protein